MIESINIVGTFEECVEELELVSCIEVIKSKWLEYYKTIPTIYLLTLIFFLHCKIENLAEYLDGYYKYLGLTLDVSTFMKDTKKLFFELYDEYGKYGSSFNINFGETKPPSQALTFRIGKRN